jgi:hypothetical protein
MVQMHSSLPNKASRETELLNRLLGLYSEEQQLYTKVLHLSQRQGQIIDRGAPLADVRTILEQKKSCLDVISRLEATEHNHRQEWEINRTRFSARSRNLLHAALQEVSTLIEEILACEENNDLKLIQQTRAM